MLQVSFFIHYCVLSFPSLLHFNSYLEFIYHYSHPTADSLNVPPTKKKSRPLDDGAEIPSVNLQLATLQDVLLLEVGSPADSSIPPNQDSSNPPDPITHDVNKTDNVLELNNVLDRFEPASCRVLTSKEIRDLNSRVILYTDSEEHVFHHGSMDFYLMEGTRHYLHCFENKTPLSNPATNPRVQINYPQEVDYFSDLLSICRASSTAGLLSSECRPLLGRGVATCPSGQLFRRHFSGLHVCIATLIQFVLQHADINEKRDGNKRRRIGFGCAGQASVQLEDGSWAPIDTYGFGVFDRIQDAAKRKSIMQMLADILDGMQDCEDEIEVGILRNGLSYNCEPRVEKYAKKLRQRIGAKRFRREDVSLQVKWISTGERVGSHRDELNCSWGRYSKTAALCFTLRDKRGDDWSLKVITNSRRKIGDFFNRKFKLDEIFTRIRSQLALLDYAFEKFQARYNGNHRYPMKLSHKTFKTLVLDDDCPWECCDIGNDISIKRIVFPAGPVRDLFLSAAAHPIFEIYQRTKDCRKALRLAVIAAYQTGFHRFFYISSNSMDEMIVGDPALVYYKKAMSLFGKISGDPQVGRISPSGVQFEKVFLDNSDPIEMNSVLGKMVEDILQLLLWINSKVGTDEFNHVNVERQFKLMLEDWKGLQTDIAEFRLMLVVQICCLAGVVVKPHKDLHNLVYPVSSLGAAKQLEHVPRGERGIVLDTVIRQFGMEEFGHNAGEGMLCETSETRVGKIFDVVFRGQHQFTFGVNGDQLVKEYGKREWVNI